jgi:TonB-linked SusC/RagA family outer membrane protein
MRKVALLLACLMFLSTQFLQAQNRTITGKVTNSEDGSSIPGVAISVKGTTVGTTTDISGKYQLSVPGTAKTLVFQFIGMKTKEVALGTSNVVDVILDPDVLDIEGVVVTAIGIKRETKALGYAVQEVGAEELNRTTNANVVNAIGGKVAGVQVTSGSGVAGGSSYITIRGTSSITGNNQPLFVIDGVPMDNSQLYSGNPDAGSNNLTNGVAYSNRAIDINPDDIESIAVLKGGAATALYGLRAANGAVIITTKSGATNADRLNVDIHSSVSIEQVNKLPEFQMKYAQGYDGLWRGPETGWAFTWGPNYDTLSWNGDTSYIWDKNGKLVGDSDPTAKTKAEPYDNAGDFFQTGTTFSNNISLSGGGAKASYYFSIGDMKVNGVIPNNIWRKTNVSISGDAQIYAKLKAMGRVTYIKSGGNRIQQGSNISGIALGLFRTPPSFDNSNGIEDPMSDPMAYSFPDGRQRTYRGGGGYDNPWWSVNKNILNDDVNRMLGNFGFVYTPTEWMTITYRLGNDFYSDRRSYRFAINSRAYPAGQVSEDHHFVQDINSDLIINLRKDFGDKIKTTATIGQNMYQSVYQQQYMQGDQLAIPDFYHMSNATAVIAREFSSKKRTAALYADLGMSYAEMFFINVTGRNEWSTSLPEANNSFFFPSVSAGFIFTEIPALKNNSFLPFGKLRASYAQIANDAPVYGTMTGYSAATFGDGWTNGIAFPMLNLPGFFYGTGGTLGNPDLKPEMLKSFEVGVDLRFWQNRFGLDVTYYNNQNTDLILGVPIAASTGSRAIILNSATMENKGWEISATITPIKTKDFNWELMVNYTRNRNMVLSLAEGVDEVGLGGFVGATINAVEGLPYATIFGTQWERDDDGNILIEDDTTAWNYGFPTTAVEEAPFGTAQPDWTMGINNQFQYKGWTLSFLIDIKQGGIMWNGTRGALNYFGTGKDTETRDSETKVFEGVKRSDGSPNDIEVALGQNWYIDGEGSGFTGPSENFLEDASWVRLKELYLGYKFAPSFLEKTPVRNLELYFSGRNLWLSTPYTGIDPETSLYGAANAQGIDYFNMPGTKAYTFGVKLAF